jgi:hypothetical protein
MVSFTSQPLYPQRNKLRYPLDRRLGGPQSRSGLGVKEKNSQPPAGNRTTIIRSSSAQPVAIPTELSRLFINWVNGIERKGSCEWREGSGFGLFLGRLDVDEPNVINLLQFHALNTA